MNTTNAAVATGVIVTAGRWSEGKGLDLKVAVGVTVFALSLSLISGANEKLAQQFSVLVLVAALLRYVIPITSGLGLTKKEKK